MTEEEAKSMGDLFPDLGPEAPVISGIAHDRSEAPATVRGVPNEPGMAAKVFTELATAGVNVDMIVQAGASVGTADIPSPCPKWPSSRFDNTLPTSRKCWATTPSMWTPTWARWPWWALA